MVFGYFRFGQRIFIYRYVLIFTVHLNNMKTTQMYFHIVNVETVNIHARPSLHICPVTKHFDICVKSAQISTKKKKKSKNFWAVLQDKCFSIQKYSKAHRFVFLIQMWGSDCIVEILSVSQILPLPTWFSFLLTNQNFYSSHRQVRTCILFSFPKRSSPQW